MNKSQLVEKIVADTNLGRSEVETVLKHFVDTVQQSVKRGEKVSLPGFGGWSQTQRKARTARNPRTGAPVKVPAGKGVRFTVGATFKDVVAAKRGTAAAKPANKASTAKSAPAKKTAPAKASTKASPAKASSKAAPAKKTAKAGSSAKKATPAKKATKK